MATIKTTGSGSALRIITKTVGGQVRVSCGCCGNVLPCDSFGEQPQVNFTFSGIERCPFADQFPLPNGMYTLTFNEGLEQYLSMDENFQMFMNCSPVFGLALGVLYLQGDYTYVPYVFQASGMSEQNVAYPNQLDFDNCGEGEEPYIGHGGIVSFEFVG